MRACIIRETWPGWFFYASTKADPRNAFWRDMPLLNTYVARSQSILQAGYPANDVLLYWPIHDYWMDSDGMDRRMTVHHPEWMADQPVGAAAQRSRVGGGRRRRRLLVADGCLLLSRHSAPLVPADRSFR